MPQLVRRTGQFRRPHVIHAVSEFSASPTVGGDKSRLRTRIFGVARIGTCLRIGGLGTDAGRGSPADVCGAGCSVLADTTKARGGRSTLLRAGPPLVVTRTDEPRNVLAMTLAELLALLNTPRPAGRLRVGEPLPARLLSDDMRIFGVRAARFYELVQQGSVRPVRAQADDWPARVERPPRPAVPGLRGACVAVRRGERPSSPDPTPSYSSRRIPRAIRSCSGVRPGAFP